MVYRVPHRVSKKALIRGPRGMPLPLVTPRYLAGTRVSEDLSPSAVVSAGFILNKSCRFNDNDSASLSKTFSGAGDLRQLTFEIWLKRCSGFGARHCLLSSTVSSGTSIIVFDLSDRLEIQHETSGGSRIAHRITTQVFRDPTAWYNIVIGLDGDQSDDTSCKIEVNGVEVTAYDTKTNAGAADGTFLAAVAHKMLEHVQGDQQFFDGYVARITCIDGQKLSASSFGETDDNGNWVPKDVSALTFGTNGFLLDFAVAPGTSDGAGTDVSGEDNHWTDRNLVAGDQMSDSPTDSAADNVGNFCTFNPIYQNGPSGHIESTITDGNLTAGSSGYGGATATIGVPSGKWYFEFTMVDAAWGSATGVGITSTENFWTNGTNIGQAIYLVNGNKKLETVASSYGSAFSQGDVIGVALDMDNTAIFFSVNDSWQNSATQAEIEAGTTTNAATASLSAEAWGPGFNSGTNGDTCTLNTGQSAFSGTIPSGFKRLCTANLPTPTIKDPSKYFQTKLFTGTGAELAITLTNAAGAAVKPDLVWIKDRDTAVEYVLTDSARGATKEWNPDSSLVESTVAQGVKSFDTSGFTLGTDTNYNASSSLNVAWCWNTQGGAGSSNTAGSINTTTTSVGTTQGFSISTYTGTGVAATVGHGLGVTPEFIFVKRLDVSAGDAVVYHKNLVSLPETDFMYLSDTDGSTDNNTMWNDTVPTSTVFSILSSGNTNISGTKYAAYCWAGVEGYSKFGTYEGNANANGTFVWCGFRPAFVLCKSIDSTSSWYLFDDKRLGYNFENENLLVDAVSSEDGTTLIDLLSNGFKLRNSVDPNVAETWVFAAFASRPFGGDGVSQARAR